MPQFAGMAQSVEQFTRNEQVIGSNPITSSKKTTPVPFVERENFIKRGFYMNKKVTSIVSYCTIIGWLVAYLAGDKENAKFHLNQGLVLGIFGTGMELVLSIVDAILGGIAKLGGIIGILFGIMNWIVGLIGFVSGILVGVLIVVGIINAVNDKEEKLPVIGGITILK